jgi:hypothetical protein
VALPAFGSADAGAISMAVAYPTSIAAGALLILQVVKQTTASTTITPGSE